MGGRDQWNRRDVEVRGEPAVGCVLLLTAFLLIVVGAWVLSRLVGGQLDRMGF